MTKTSLNKFRNFEITSCILFDHYTLKIEINNTEMPESA